ncbi:sulfurtransferase [Microbulbifer hainanensis]|uniref:sulfurtransferase n=1 Tax=Microbulbifer hainanensis TaxID=2735675 RepID=UPI001866C1A2|nr:sulfurtransferase [Microbulbifer hainanensis]
MSEQAVIEVRQLEEMSPESKVVILDCRYNLADPDAGARSYAEGHIPEARYASLHRDLSAPLQRYGGRHPLPDPQQFQQFARAAGIDADTQVIVYDDNRFAFAARAWWLFRYFGHCKIAVLNGGFGAWQQAGLPVETGAPPAPPRSGNIVCTPREEMLVRYEQIHRQLDNPPWQLVDARDAARFAGVEEPIDPIAGHIPSAVNKPWAEISREDGTVKSRDELIAHWGDLPSDELLLNYCGSGVTACVNLFSLHLIGRDDALLYPGSWSDWCAHIVYPETATG